MRNSILFFGFLFGLSAVTLRAGSVVTMADSPEAGGKLTLNGTTIHVESSFPADIGVADVLEADFSDADFHLDAFSSSGGSGQLPAGWKTQDVGPLTVTGTVTYADGALTLTGAGTEIKPKEKPVGQYFFVGQPWSGNGQWTVRVKEIDGQTPQAEVGLMLRDGLDATSSQVRLGATAAYKGRALNGPMAEFLWSQGSSPGNRGGHASHRPAVDIQLPVWLRMTQNGDNLDASVSKDGKTWESIGQDADKVPANAWIGFFIDSHSGTTVGKAVVDQVSFVPGPCASQVVPAGVLLRSGSFLAGSFTSLNLDPATPDAPGNFRRKVRSVAIPPSKIATVVIQPTTRNQIAEQSSQVGLIMKNGDFLAGTPQAIGGSTIRFSSLVLGIASYTTIEVSACVLHPLQPLPAAYEVRLKDGSIIRASGVSGNRGDVAIDEISGLSVSVAQDEIAQVRAGSAQVQSLLELPWTATPPTAAPAAPAPLLANPAPVNAATNGAPVTPVPGTNTAPPANPGMVPPPAVAPNVAPDAAASVECWGGDNQEQILVVPIETTVDFPLKGKFRGLAMKVALAPDAAPMAQATVRVLADGREIGRAVFKAGDQPRFMEVALQEPKTVTLVADAPFAGTRVLFIDPVVIR